MTTTTPAANRIVRHFFKVSVEGSARPRVSIAYTTAITVGKSTTFAYTDRNGVTRTIDRKAFDAKWTREGYFSEHGKDPKVTAARKFGTDGNLIREGAGTKVRTDAPKVPTF